MHESFECRQPCRCVVFGLVQHVHQESHSITNSLQALNPRSCLHCDACPTLILSLPQSQQLPSGLQRQRDRTEPQTAKPPSSKQQWEGAIKVAAPGTASGVASIAFQQGPVHKCTRTLPTDTKDPSRDPGRRSGLEPKWLRMLLLLDAGLDVQKE